MEVSVSNQLYVFLWMTICGVCSGAVFDLFRTLRKTFGARDLTTSLSDILFWLIISIGMFFAMFYISGCEIRWHGVIGVALGAIIYFLGLSKIFMVITSAFLRFFIKIFITISKIILTPFVFLYKMIKRPLCYVFGVLRRIMRKFFALFIWLAHSFGKVKLVIKKS